MTTEVVVTGVDPGFTPTVPDTDDVAAIEAAVAAQLPPGSGFTVTVDKVLTDTTTELSTSLEVTVSEDASYIGNLNDPTNLIVLTGTVTVTTTETTTETRHYLRTVTIDILWLTPETEDDCKEDGWMNLADHNGRPFKNQGDCVSYVATRGSNLAAG